MNLHQAALRVQAGQTLRRGDLAISHAQAIAEDWRIESPAPEPQPQQPNFAQIEAATLAKYPLLRQVTTQDNLRRKFCMIVHNMEQLGFDPRVTETLRTPARQRELVAAGHSQTQNSLHLAGQDGLARAMDVVDRQLLWGAPERFWITLGRLALMQGCHWGGLFGLPKAERDRFVSFLTDVKRPFRAENWQARRGWDPAHIEIKR